MARMGSFGTAPALVGEPMSVVHPPDNNVLSSKYADQLNDPSLKLTDAQKQELQDRLNELYASLRGERDYGPWQP